MNQLIDYQAELDELTRQENLSTFVMKTAETKQLYDRLDKGEKTYLATLKNKLSGSDAARTTEALASPEWTKYLKSLNDTRAIYLMDKAKEETIKTRIDALRTIISSLSKSPV